MSEDFKSVQKIANEAAQEGGKVLMSYWGRIEEVKVKKFAGLLTEADNAAEDKIISIIKRKYPTHSILAEESGEEAQSSAYKWIIDPLDGTTNFAHKIPMFCSSVAVEKDGEIVAAAVSDPIHRDFYSASKGNGVTRNGQPLKSSETKKLEDSLIATGFAYQRGKALEQAVNILTPFMQMTRGIRRCGSAVWDLCQVADGRFDGFWEKNLKPWDVAAGFLFIREAGGHISKYDGTPASVYDQEIVASNGGIHQQMIDVIARY